jgi:DNA-directed RNA polymerase specialized sigma24 family protein
MMRAAISMLRPTPSPDPLADPELHRFLEGFVRKRAPAADVDDLVQAVLCDALAAEGRPSDGTELRRYLLGIARHKIADLHRRAVREPATELPEMAAHPAPIEAREMARWAEEQVEPTSEAKRTLSWMAREGEGEKLETIAADENIPATRVRQRVSRMRRWMKERWLAELAAVAALGLLIVIVVRWLRAPDQPREAIVPDVPTTAPIAPEPPSDLERARTLRADALKRCEARSWRACLDGLDEAARLDPAGDQAESIQRARTEARSRLQEQENPKAPPNDEKPPEKTEIIKPPPPKPVVTSEPINEKESKTAPRKPPAPVRTSTPPKAPPPRKDLKGKTELFDDKK